MYVCMYVGRGALVFVYCPSTELVQRLRQTFRFNPEGYRHTIIPRLRDHPIMGRTHIKRVARHPDSIIRSARILWLNKAHNTTAVMAFKFLAFVAMVATARAGFIGAPGAIQYASPVAAAPVAKLAYAAQPAVSYAAQPALSYAAQPVAYAAPAAHVQVAHAAPVAHAYAPVAYAAAPVAKVVKTVDAEYDPNPQYSYAYDVQDALTGDSKTQQESRNGDVVQGSYSLVEPDGTRRIVEYTADEHNGFNAVVHKEPAQVAVKTVAAAPALVNAHYASPAAYHL
ncbi:cuticle protein 21-like [Leptopilina heterotoma]|uniref:cuticle protein 21-like n=1 Tax=Leptopilina heterotoma TaxID=63436 RepID=UPI001CA7ED20|nr:cuticle protein 21-like [Leptopilina heterotoma]